jgi:hypothetical protein
MILTKVAIYIILGDEIIYGQVRAFIEDAEDDGV